MQELQNEKIFVEMKAEQLAGHISGCFGYYSFKNSDCAVFP